MQAVFLQRRSSILLPYGLVCLLVCSFMMGVAIPVMAMPQESDEGAVVEQAAWEYRPYNVVVWLAHENSWRLQGLEDQIVEGIAERAHLADPSSWKLTIVRAPNPWNWRVLASDFDRQLYANDLQADVINAAETQNADKLIIVKIKENLGEFDTEVQEFDLRTKVWGAKVVRKAETKNLASVIFDSISTAFMPITRIENVLDKDVRVRVRAIGVCEIAERNVEGAWELSQNTGSPAWIDDDEILMPVVLRKDRRGNLDNISTVDWTFLSILERSGPNLNCTTHAMRRAPLGGRTGGRTERLGLCVRAPDRQTRLKLLSNDKERIPLPDLEIYSRNPDTPKDQESEFIGKTDWRGEIVIPPNDDPIRILFVKSGRRGLARVPMVPGLYDQQQTTMPNDEKRLYAEGITRGLFNELMDNVARRQLIAERFRIALENNNLEKASELVKELRDVPDANNFKRRLNMEKQDLLSGDIDKREVDFIKGYFLQLENATSNFLNGVKDGQLNRDLQAARQK